MPSSPTLSVKAAALWSEIIGITREACLLRQEGREKEAVELLQQTLPAVIRRWSNSCGETPEYCREALRKLFAEEQHTARAAMVQRRLIVDEVCSRLKVRCAAARDTGENESGVVLKAPVGPVQLRRRVSIDDVVGMLDALQQAERTALEEAILPVRETYSSLSSVGQRSLQDAACE